MTLPVLTGVEDAGEITNVGCVNCIDLEREKTTFSQFSLTYITYFSYLYNDGFFYGNLWAKEDLPMNISCLKA